MKNPQNIQCVILVSICLLFITCLASCSSDSVELDNKNIDCAKDCFWGAPGSLEIEKKCAKCVRENYANNQYKFPKYKNQEVKGFMIHHGELKQILDAVGNDSNATLYAMLSIRDSIVDEKTNKYIQIPDLVFVLKTLNSSNRNIADTILPMYSYSYFDFTQPCPDWCPDDE